MALFGWKKSSESDKPQTNGSGGSGSGGATAAGSAGGGGYEFSPEKANRWFHHARTSNEAGNYEYAMTCWLSGLRFEPTNIDAINAFFASTAQNGQGVPKAVANAVGGKTDVDKFLGALLNFACKTSDAELAVRTVSAASDVGLNDVVGHLGPIALKILMGSPKPRKDQFTRVMVAATKAGNFDIAGKAGEGAMRLDPADTKLATDVRNLAAQGTMTRGGYDQTDRKAASVPMFATLQSNRCSTSRSAWCAPNLFRIARSRQQRLNTRLARRIGPRSRSMPRNYSRGNVPRT